MSICLDDGSSCAGIAVDTNALSEFWQREAGITLNVLPAREFNSDRFRFIDNDAELSALFFQNPHDDSAVAPGLAAPISTIWFSTSGPSFGVLSNGVIAGNRGWVASGASMSASVQTIFTAMILGFNLGLELLPQNIDNNLMNPIFLSTDSLFGKALTEQQVAVVTTSRLLSTPENPDAPAIPVPGSFLLIALGGILLALSRGIRSTYVLRARVT